MTQFDRHRKFSGVVNSKLRFVLIYIYIHKIYIYIYKNTSLIVSNYDQIESSCIANSVALSTANCQQQIERYFSQSIPPRKLRGIPPRNKYLKKNTSLRNYLSILRNYLSICKNICEITSQFAKIPLDLQKYLSICTAWRRQWPHNRLSCVWLWK